MKKILLFLSFICLSMTVFSQANIKYVRSYDSTFYILDQAFPDDTLWKFTKDGYLIKYVSNSPSDTMLYKSEQSDLTIDTANIRLLRFNASITIPDYLEGQTYYNSTYDAVESKNGFRVSNMSGNKGTKIDSATVYTYTLQFGDGTNDTYIDSTSVTTDTIYSIGDTLFMKNIKLTDYNNGYYTDNPMLLDRRNLQQYQEFIIGKPTGYSSYIHKLTLGYAGLDLWAQPSSTYHNSFARLKVIGNSVVASTQSLNRNSQFVLDSMNYRLHLDGGGFSIYNSDASDSLLKVEPDSVKIFVPTNIDNTLDVSGGFSIGGGDVLTTSDTIFLKTAVESEVFDSINVTKADIDTIDGDLTVIGHHSSLQYRTSGALHPDSTFTQAITSTWELLNIKPKFTGFTFYGFSYDGDTLQFDQDVTDSRDSIAFDFNWHTGSATSGTNVTVYYGLFVKSVGDADYTEIWRTTFSNRLATAGQNYSWGCAVMPVFLKDGDKIQLRVKTASSSVTLTVNEFALNLKE